MRKHDAERQDDKNRNLTLPLERVRWKSSGVFSCIESKSVPSYRREEPPNRLVGWRRIELEISTLPSQEPQVLEIAPAYTHGSSDRQLWVTPLEEVYLRDGGGSGQGFTNLVARCN
jgi:hypothetical protein